MPSVTVTVIALTGSPDSGIRAYLGGPTWDDLFGSLVTTRRLLDQAQRIQPRAADV